MQLFNMRDHISSDKIDRFIKYMDTMEWYHGAPGGFLTNRPNRKVNAFGSGASIDNKGKLSSDGWPTTYWTAKINQSNVTLETPTCEIPEALRDLIPTFRQLFRETYPDASLTDNTFTIAVCNYYTDPNMNIAAHTDDNKWYPSECDAGPVFASLTLYPKGVPETDKGYARFQVRQDGKWCPVKLPHESVLIMPSGLEHRVLSFPKRDYTHFRPRINITFRSTYSLDKNPLMNAMAVANHTRYYRIPSVVSYPDTLCDIVAGTIWDAYNQFALAHGYQPVTCLTFIDRNTRLYREEMRNLYQQLCNRQGYPQVTMATNIVAELVEMVVYRLKN